VARLADSVPVTVIRRPPGADNVQDVLAAIEGDA
jgi:hypothetical protein